jgi:hypothetical protein
MGGIFYECTGDYQLGARLSALMAVSAIYVQRLTDCREKLSAQT